MPNDAKSTKKGNTQAAALGASPQSTINNPLTDYSTNMLKKDILIPKQFKITGAIRKPVTPQKEKIAELR